MLPQFKPINEDYSGGGMPMRRSTSSDYKPGESARLDAAIGYPSASLGAFGGYYGSAADDVGMDRPAPRPSPMGNSFTAPMPSMSSMAEPTMAEPSTTGTPFGLSAPTVASAGVGAAASLAGLGPFSGPLGALAGYAAGNSPGKSIAQGIGSGIGFALGNAPGSAIFGYLAGKAFDFFSPPDQLDAANAFPAVETYNLAAPWSDPDAVAANGGGSMFGGESGPEGYGGDPDGHR